MSGKWDGCWLEERWGGETGGSAGCSMSTLGVCLAKRLRDGSGRSFSMETDPSRVRVHVYGGGRGRRRGRDACVVHVEPRGIPPAPANTTSTTRTTANHQPPTTNHQNPPSPPQQPQVLKSQSHFDPARPLSPWRLPKQPASGLSGREPTHVRIKSERPLIHAPRNLPRRFHAEVLETDSSPPTKHSQTETGTGGNYPVPFGVNYPGKASKSLGRSREMLID